MNFPTHGEITQFLHIYLTVPVSTATAERSSTLRGIEARLISTVPQKVLILVQSCC
jgi:hypothetical protein